MCVVATDEHEFASNIFQVRDSWLGVPFLSIGGDVMSLQYFR